MWPFERRSYNLMRDESDCESTSEIKCSAEYEMGRQNQRSHSIFSVLKNVFLVVFVGLFITGFAITVAERKELRTLRDALQQQGILEKGHVMSKSGKKDPQAFFPNFPAVTRVFESSEKFKDAGPVGDHYWNELVPIGAGYLRVENPRQYDMPESMPWIAENEDLPRPGDDSETYAISATHQMHCLAILRAVLIAYEKGGVSEYANEGHVHHCLDYIRQAILCAGDTSLEHAKKKWDPVTNETSYTYNGAGTRHQCRDWAGISDFIVEHRADDRKGTVNI